RNFSQAFEAGDFWLASELVNGTLSLFVRVAIDRLLLIPHSKQRSFEDEQMTVSHQIRKELEEVSHDQQPDVHAIHIRIGGNYNLAIPKAIDSVFDIQGVLQKVKLLIFIHDLLGHTKAIERLSTKRKYSLRLHVAGFGDRTRGGISLRDEEHRVVFGVLVRFGIIVVYATVPQFLVVEIGFFGAFVREFFDAGNLFSFTL